MSIAYNGRVGQLILQKVKISNIFEGQVLDQEYLYEVAGAQGRCGY